MNHLAEDDFLRLEQELQNIREAIPELPLDDLPALAARAWHLSLKINRRQGECSSRVLRRAYRDLYFDAIEAEVEINERSDGARG